MCRIAGIVDVKNNPSLALLQTMTNAMQRGGPDDAGTYLNEDLHIALGHRRLSLIDLSALGHQPMYSKNGNIVLVFNGEIYNYLTIKEKLKKKGYSFISNSDTEVIIYAYEEWGIACLEHFNGMFALALLDIKRQKLFLARDHAGIKPLYYSLTNEKLIFASEVRAFKSLDPYWQENPDWKKYFLTYGFIPEHNTTLQNLKSLTKVSYLEIEIPTLKSTSHIFYTPTYNYTINDLPTAVQKVKETLIAAVERHLIADAPIGLFLSGGLDSSLLTIIAQRFIPNQLRTLSIIFDDEKYSEKMYQDIVIQQTKANHHSYLVTEKDFMAALPDILEAMDQPSNDGVNTYFISKYAKEYGLKAVLSGIGADELFGGYQSFQRLKKIRAIKWMPNFMLMATSSFSNDKLKKLSFLASSNGMGDYLINRGFFIPKQIAEILDCSVEEVINTLQNSKIPQWVNDLLPEEKNSYLETNIYMQNQLLKDADYMSMWHSLEIRVPFLDKELIQLVHSIHPSIKFNPNQIKFLLVEAFKDVVPEAVWKRPKQGFTFPFESWIKNVPIPPNVIAQPSFTKMHNQFLQNKLHWSRYWGYLLTQSAFTQTKKNA